MYSLFLRRYEGRSFVLKILYKKISELCLINRTDWQH